MIAIRSEVGIDWTRSEVSLEPCPSLELKDYRTAPIVSPLHRFPFVGDAKVFFPEEESLQTHSERIYRELS